MKFEATIRGIAPLLMHKFEEEMITGTKKVKGDKVLSADQKRDEASQFLYTNKAGKLVIPAINIEASMIKAATELRLSGSGKKTYKDLFKSSVFVFPEKVEIKQQDWIVDARGVVNPATKGRRMSYRPRLDEWELTFQIEVLDNRADPEAIKEILTLAGLRQGIGSYRPRFGRYEVTSFKQVEN